MFIVEAFFVAILSRRDDDDSASFFDKIDKVLGIVGFVSDNEDAIPVGEQRFGLRDIMTLTAGEQKDQGVAQGIDQHVNLGAEAAAAAA